MPGVYISCHRNENGLAEYIAKGLRQRGAEVYWDYQQVLTGEDFIGRLGPEIDRRAQFVVVLDTAAVESKWVRAEVAWALYAKKPICVVLLETHVDLTDFLFLFDAPRIDFSAWLKDMAQTNAALQKLAAALRLPAEPVAPVLTSEDGTPLPEVIFNTVDKDRLALEAFQLEKQNPEQAYFIYRLLSQLDPDNRDVRINQFLTRRAPRLREAWAARLLERMRKALAEGQWDTARRLAEDVLRLQPSNIQALDAVAACEQNRGWDVIYQQASQVAAAGQWKAASHLLASIKHACPTYGDPQELLVLRPESVSAVQQAVTLTIPESGLAVTAVAFSPDGRLLASAWTDHVIRLWEIAGGNLLAQAPSTTGEVVSLAFSQGGGVLISAANDEDERGAVQTWLVKDGDLREHRRPVGNTVSTAVATSPDKLYMAAAVEEYANIADYILGKRNCIRVWLTDTNRQMVMYKGLPGSTRHTQFVAFSPDSRLLVSDLGQHTIKLWDLNHRERSEPLLELEGHADSVSTAAFSADGRWLVSGSVDKTVRLWGLGAEQPESEILAVEEFPIMRLALSPDSRLLVTAQDGISLRVWDVARRASLLCVEAHKGTINGLTFSPDGTCFASASADGTIKVWGLC